MTNDAKDALLPDKEPNCAGQLDYELETAEFEAWFSDRYKAEIAENKEMVKRFGAAYDTISMLLKKKREDWNEIRAATAKLGLTANQRYRLDRTEYCLERTQKLEDELRAASDREKKLVEALRMAVTAIKSSVVHVTGDGVWITTRVRGHAMFGLTEGHYLPEYIESFKEVARLNDVALDTASALLTAYDDKDKGGKDA